MSEEELNREFRHANKRNRLGSNAKCELCGEHDLRILRKVGKHILCPECHLESQGKVPIENHHPPGKNNGDFCFPIPANTHAILSDAQYDWPRETLRNPNKDPLLEIAAWFRGIHDLLIHLADKLLDWAYLLEIVSRFLAGVIGPNWLSKVAGEEDEYKE